MLNVVYVLVCDAKNYFYEQFLISATSLRYRMQEVSITLLVEQCTNEYIKRVYPRVIDIVNNIVVYEIGENYSMAARARILKTRMRELISGDFLYLDCDTVVCTSVEEITKCKHSSAVIDNHMEVTYDINEFQGIVDRAKQFNFSVGYQNKHFNSGVLWCKDDDETREFFSLWHAVWKETYEKGVKIDQLSLNEINNRTKGILHELDGTWNCQLRYGLPYLANAKIIHYFASNFDSKNIRNFAYDLSESAVYKKIRDKGEIPEEIMEMIKNPRCAFEHAILIEVGSVNYKIINSNIGALARTLYRKKLGLYKYIDKFLGIIRGIK